MEERLTQLMLEQPFERIMEIAAEEGVTVHHDPNRGDYHCVYHYSEGDGFSEVTVAPQKKIRLAVIYALLNKHRSGR